MTDKQHLEVLECVNGKFVFAPDKTVRKMKATCLGWATQSVIFLGIEDSPEVLLLNLDKINSAEKHISLLKKHSFPVKKILADHQHSRVLSLSKNEVILWDAITHEAIAQIKDGKPLTDIQF